MAEKKIKWTEQQLRAIKEHGIDVLVGASAGTGKTAVLSGSCVDVVSDKNIRVNVWNMLVLTFTEMAAEQMRSRIGEQLKAEFLKSRDRHLRHQLVLLDGADISTIHSFCKRLLTEYFYKLGLDPTFGIIDGDEAKLLKAEVLERTIEWAWQQSNLRAALEQLFYRRDLRTTGGFGAKIIGLSDFLDGVISREKWYERATLLAEAVNPFATELGRKQKQIVAERLQVIQNQLLHAQMLYASKNAGGDWFEKYEDTFIKPVARCIEFLEGGDWEGCSEEIRNFKKPRVNKPKELPESIAELIRRTVKKAVDGFVKLSELAVLNPDYLDKVSGSAGLQTRVLVELVKKFDRLYSQAKQRINCLDFADLEHYALKLLSDENSPEDKLLPSETALVLRRKYKYVFVDEYQDINRVQQAILEMLSSGGNVFVVGDVKQSIYAWRGAEPEIFIKELKSASADPGSSLNGLRVELNANFRSARGILDFINKIFGRIMTDSLVKVDYEQSAKLRPAIEYKSKEPAEKSIVELHILDEADVDSDSESQEVSGLADEEDLNPVGNSTTISNGLNVISGRQRQAAMIAQRIRQMVGADTGRVEFQIYDKQQDKFRDVEYRDIVILMRSLAKKANDYVEVLQLSGVPVSCEATAGYFETTEISDLVALLKVLDNPQRDIELAAVLRSPFFKISDTELAEIKTHSKTNQQCRGFYDFVVEYRNSGRDAKLAGRLKEILAVIEQWRMLGRRGNLADLVWQIYRQSGFLSFVSALPNGQARRANLLKLHERAIQFEDFAGSSGGLSLKRFVEFIEKLQEAGQDWSPAEPESAAGNAVRILSVHKSKGLEFPVVFLAELGSQFNKRDIQSELLAGAADTVGLQIIDRKSNSRLSSLAHQVISEQKVLTALAEEMRILYVATTRARERLVLTACEKLNNCRDIIRNGFFFGRRPIPDWQLRRCQSPLEWVLYGLCDQKSLHSAFETGLTGGADDDLFSIKLYGRIEQQQLSEFIVKIKRSKTSRRAAAAGRLQRKQKETKLAGRVRKSLGWRYQFGDVVLLPAKRSVTQLTHRGDEYVRIDYSRALAREPMAIVSAEPGLAEPVEGRLTGTATHLVIARLDLARAINKEAIKQIKEKLLADGAITEAVAGHIDTESIIAFFESELGGAALDTNNTVWREWPFTFAVPAAIVARVPSLVAGVTNDESIIVQGIIDMLVQTPKGLLVIDFKTDDVTAEQVAERAEVYREQLELYGRAASAILKTNLLGKWLYFLTPATEFEIK